MRNRDKWRGLRARDVKVYPCRVLVENGRPVERVIGAAKAATNRGSLLTSACFGRQFAFGPSPPSAVQQRPRECYAA
jgi:hypothetical protein